MQRLTILIIGILVCLSLEAQVEDANASPYSAVYNHLYYLQPDSYLPDLAARSMGQDGDSSTMRQLAIQLKQIYDGKGLFVRLNIIPTENDFFDSIGQTYSYSPFPQDLPEVYVEMKEGEWYYSNQTLEAIPDLHNEVYPFGSDFLVDLLPKKGHTKFLGLYLWQYLGFLLIIIIGLVFYILANWIVKKIIYSLKAVSRSFLKDQGKALRGTHRMVAAYLLFRFLSFLLPILQLPVRASEFTFLVFDILSSIVVLLFFLRVFDLVLAYMDKVTKATESKMDEQLLPLVKRAGQFVIISLWLLHILSVLDVNVTAMIAGISIGGLAIALAAQDTLKNLFGSITIFLDRPFQVGDWIATGDAEGTVEEVGFRSTRIRSFANSLISLPNSKLSDSKIDNFGLRKYRRFKTTIGITYNTPPDKIEAFVDGLRELVANNSNVLQDNYEIHLNNMGPSALEILFYIFLEVPDWKTELATKHDLILDIIKLAASLGVDFAFPSQSIYIENQS